MNNTDWMERTDYWRDRANKFELALRQIEAVKGTDAEEVSSDRWEIARKALEESKK